MDQDDIDRAIRRGQRAKIILDDELVREARAEVRAEITKAWAESPVRDAEGRENLYLMLRMHDRVWQRLESVLDGGKFADAALPPDQRRGLLNP